MKSLAIFCVFVTVATLVPVSGQVSSGGTARTQHPKQKTHSTQKPAPQTPSSTLTENSNAPALEDDSKQQKPADNPQSVVISKPPSVTVVKTGIDWGVLANFLLVAVGIGGIWTAVCTLKKIERQTATTEKSLILQFRPKIIVRGGLVDSGKVMFTVTNIGGSPAHVVVGKVRPVSLGEGKDLSGLMDGPNDIPVGTTFVAGESKVLPLSVDEDLLEIIAEIDEAHVAIPGGISRRQIYCVGSIQYKDDLGIERLTGIYRRYSPRSGRFHPSEDKDLEYAD